MDAVGRLNLDGDGRLDWAEHIADKKWFLDE
jgi:hypothetical protein